MFNNEYEGKGRFFLVTLSHFHMNFMVFTLTIVNKVPYTLTIILTKTAYLKIVNSLS